jgi:hypothetical protein
MQALIERTSKRQDTAARTRLGLEDDDGHAGLVKKIRRAETSEAAADDGYERVGIQLTRGDAAKGGCRERNRTRRLLKKSSAIQRAERKTS